MADLYIIVEGYGEKGFIDECVAPHLGTRGVYANACLIGKPSHKGGVRPWASARKEIMNFLKMGRPDRPIHVSTMFDYFRLPMDWPGRGCAGNKPPDSRAAHVEGCIAADVSTSLGPEFNPKRFIPYIQMHELEALVLAEPNSLAAEFLGQDVAVGNLADSIANKAPEDINDGPNTAPSKRIIAHIPEYEKRKAQAVVNVLYCTGLATLRQRCPHFNQWLQQLERLI